MKLSLPSSPGYRTITSFNSAVDRSDRTVTSTYVFRAKIGTFLVICLPFKKRHMDSFHFFCTGSPCNYIDCKKKKLSVHSTISGYYSPFS